MINQEKIHIQSLSYDAEERHEALKQLTNNFSLMPDREQAWDDLHTLANDEESAVRLGVVFALNYEFFHMPDKQQAWNDLIRLIGDQDSSVRSRSIHALGVIFLKSQINDWLGMTCIDSLMIKIVI